VPTLDFSSTGFPKVPPTGSDRVRVQVCFSTQPNAPLTAIFPPFVLGEVSGTISIQMQLDTVTCFTNEQFIQGEVTDPTTGLPIQTTNEVVLRVDKSSCDPRPIGGEGCPAEKWLDSTTKWPIPIARPSLFDEIFDDAFPAQALETILVVGDGALRELGRQTVAALLNSWSPSVNFDLTEVQVLTLFDQTFPGSDEQYLALAAFFEGLNEQGCPIGP
jgi:hypothetical protein